MIKQLHCFAQAITLLCS